MKKIFKTIISALFTSTFGLIFANDFSLWLSPECSLSGGSFTQSVKDNRDKIISSKDFDENLISHLGLNGGFSWRFISIQSELDWAIPKNCGNLEYQRFSGGNLNILNEERNYDAKASAENISLDTKLQFEIPIIREWLSLQPFLGFRYSYARYEGSFTSGYKGVSDKYDIRLSAYGDKYAWEQNTAPISEGKDIWLIRELYDFKFGTVIHGVLFGRGFVDFEAELSPVTLINNKEYNGIDTYYLDLMKGFFKNWTLGAGTGLYLGSKKEFEIGIKVKYNILNAINGQSYHSMNENSGFEEEKEGSYTYTDAVSGTTYTENYYGAYGWTESKKWQLTIYGKYIFTFGPTHTPKSRPAREKKEKAPKVRKGKVQVKVYE